MRFGTKAMIATVLAGPAIAAMVLTGAGPANAAVTTTTHTSAASYPYMPYCSPRHLERWNFNGYNTVDVSWNGGSYTYTVNFKQRGSCLSGWLTDPNIPNGPQTGPISGTVVRNQVTFSFTYTYSGEVQGTRTYYGYIHNDGRVSGTFSQSGPQTPNNGTWSLANRVRPACPNFFPWWGYGQFGAGCPVPFFFQY
jgi:hypothetical protein